MNSNSNQIQMIPYELEQQGKTVMNKFKEFLDNYQDI